jgi:hypothetical protein
MDREKKNDMSRTPDISSIRNVDVSERKTWKRKQLSTTYTGAKKRNRAEAFPVPKKQNNET